ncbi:unnamed protein product [Victoria cruziana]
MNNRTVGIATHVMVMAVIISIMLLFWGIGILVWIYICIMGRAISRGLSDIEADRNTAEHDGMSKDELETLPCFHYDSPGQKGSPIPCGVCLEGFERGDRCRLLPLCKHIFHANCVDLWLLKMPFFSVDDLESENGRGTMSEVHGLGTAQPIAIGILVSLELSSLTAAPLIASLAIGSTLQVSTVN